MKSLVTGAAGFIGSNLVDRLLAAGDHVVGFDNFSTGQRPFLTQALQHPHFALVEGDLLDQPALNKAAEGCERIFHLAANADVRFGLHHPRCDLEQNTLATFAVLESARCHHIETIVFTSTGSVYGEASVIPTPENAPFPVQTSLYGASKLAGEALLSAYAEGFGIKAYIFRLVSIVGERYTHGHIVDFYRQLLNDPSRLHILGDGKQRKSYLYVHDAIDAIFLALEQANAAVNIFNLGANEYCEVNDSVRWICEALQLQPQLTYAGGARGWVGDSPFIYLATQKMRALGWQPKHTIQAGVIASLRFLQQNPWVLRCRPEPS